jgi:transcription initiation factor IIF auxiliary subunit
MKIAQSYEYQGDNWWQWAAWIDARPQQLEAIQSVTYTLHPSFRNPIRKITDRQSKFRIDSEGWGSFVLVARIELQSGETKLLKHELELYYP